MSYVAQHDFGFFEQSFEQPFVEDINLLVSDNHVA
jgi:hypothetical protein